MGIFTTSTIKNFITFIGKHEAVQWLGSQLFGFAGKKAADTTPGKEKVPGAFGQFFGSSDEIGFDKAVSALGDPRQTEIIRAYFAKLMLDSPAKASRFRKRVNTSFVETPDYTKQSLSEAALIGISMPFKKAVSNYESFKEEFLEIMAANNNLLNIVALITRSEDAKSGDLEKIAITFRDIHINFVNIKKSINQSAKIDSYDSFLQPVRSTKALLTSVSTNLLPITSLKKKESEKLCEMIKQNQAALAEIKKILELDIDISREQYEEMNKFFEQSLYFVTDLTDYINIGKELWNKYVNQSAKDFFTKNIANEEDFEKIIAFFKGDKNRRRGWFEKVINFFDII